jgi:aromatic-L-amino-acid/L-tryptophan decarboxylase
MQHARPRSGDVGAAIEFWQSFRSCRLNDAEDFSLDPPDWAPFRSLAHRMLDDAIDFLAGVRTRPVWQPVPPSVKTRPEQPVPLEATPLASVCDEFRREILPYATGNIHPRFFGWVHGSGQAGGLIAAMLEAAMNCNCGGRDHGAIYVEQQVLQWCRTLFGFPPRSSGLLLSGTSAANLVALAVARQAADHSVRTDGLARQGRALIAYVSSEGHESVAKAIEILGLGSSALRKIPVRPDFTLDLEALQNAIQTDRAAGLHPFCVIASAGTVNTGAIDDLEQIAALCAAEQLWFHVDGAFGALCILSEQLRPRLRGIEKADSLAFDFHKWMHVQYDAGCVLVRQGDLHRATFSVRPPYLEHLPRGLGGGDFWPCDFGPELSRSFRALRIWFAMKEHGILRLAQSIDRNCAQTRYLAARVSREPELEILAPATLNIICFRYLRPGLAESRLDVLNQTIVENIQLRGIAAPSTSRIAGRLAIRVNITNHRTRTSDLDLLVDSVLEAGRALS